MVNSHCPLCDRYEDDQDVTAADRTQNKMAPVNPI